MACATRHRNRTNPDSPGAEFEGPLSTDSPRGVHPMTVFAWRLGLLIRRCVRAALPEAVLGRGWCAMLRSSPCANQPFAHQAGSDGRAASARCLPGVIARTSDVSTSPVWATRGPNYRQRGGSPCLYGKRRQRRSQSSPVQTAAGPRSVTAAPGRRRCTTRRSKPSQRRVRSRSATDSSWS